MKIAVSSMGNSLDSNVSEQFGRCPFFIIYEAENKQTEVIPNEAKDLPGGAGPKAVGILVNNGVDILLTGRLGNNAEEALKKSKMAVVKGFSGSVKVQDAINDYLSGKQK